MKSLSYYQLSYVVFRFIFLIPALLLFFISRHRELILSDVNAWSQYRQFVDKNHLLRSLFLLLTFQPEFQSQFKMRLGGAGRFSLLGWGKVRFGIL